MHTHRSVVRSPLPALAAGMFMLVPLAVGTTPAAYAADETVVDGVSYELLNPADPAQGASATGYDEAANPGHPALVISPSVEIDGATAPVVEVAQNAFRETDIESVSLPGSVLEVGPYAFAYNPELASVSLSEGLHLIGTGAFRAGALTEIGLPDSVSRINPQAFFGNQLTDVVIPANLDTLTIGVFQRNALTRLELPPHVAHVRERAFAGNQLTFVSLPATLAEIGEGVFTDNPDLATVQFLGPEPALVNQGNTTPGDGNPIATDTDTDPRIEFRWRHGEAHAASGGFTWPTWWGFDSVPVAEVTFETWNLNVHATRFVPLAQSSAAGPWGTIDATDLPDTPTRPGHEFAYWHHLGTVWTPEVPITSDLTLSGGWIDLTRVEHITLTATPGETTVGEPVTLTAEGFNTNGDSLGDLTDEFIFDDPTDHRVALDGNQVTFAEAGTYTISGRHSVTERPAAVDIEVEPASTPLPEDGSPLPDHQTPAAPGSDEPATLAATGATISPLAGLAALLALALGSWLILTGRRRRHGGHLAR
jgi:hypothetical protein